MACTSDSGTHPAPALRRCRLSKAALRPPLKRALDLMGAALLLLLVAPTFTLVFLLVRADGGPAFAPQRRVGRAGREFEYLKFRVPAAGAGDGGTDGESLTRLGRFLRWTALDEVPQLLNVLRGDMSLVGPQPATRDELDRSYALFDGAAAYLSVRPGLTGLSQACGCGNPGLSERVALDAAYAQSPSLRADLAILARTLGTVLRCPKAR